MLIKPLNNLKEEFLHGKAFENYYILSKDDKEWGEIKKYFKGFNDILPILWIEPDGKEKELEKLICNNIFHEIFENEYPEPSLAFLQSLEMYLSNKSLKKRFQESTEKHTPLITCIDLFGKYKSLETENKELLNRFIYTSARHTPEVIFWVMVEDKPIISKGIDNIERFRGEYDIIEISKDKYINGLFEEYKL